MTVSHNKLHVEHLDGTAWNEAPVPWRWHFCYPQTTMTIGPYSFVAIYRCRCGGISESPNGPWSNRNSRKKETS